MGRPHHDRIRGLARTGADLTRRGAERAAPIVRDGATRSAQATRQGVERARVARAGRQQGRTRRQPEGETAHAAAIASAHGPVVHGFPSRRRWLAAVAAVLVPGLLVPTLATAGLLAVLTGIVALSGAGADYSSLVAGWFTLSALVGWMVCWWSSPWLLRRFDRSVDRMRSRTVTRLAVTVALVIAVGSSVLGAEILDPLGAPLLGGASALLVAVCIVGPCADAPLPRALEHLAIVVGLLTVLFGWWRWNSSFGRIESVTRAAIEGVRTGRPPEDYQQYVDWVQRIVGLVS